MRKTIVAIGNFDGVHLGHQSIFLHAKSIAVDKGLDFAVVTFTPHPRKIFQPNIAPFRITPDAVKSELIFFDSDMDSAKPDLYSVLEFDEHLQNLSADGFIDKILIQELNAAYVIVGRDFHFGHKRGGNIETLIARTEFQTLAADLIEIDGDVVSSTRIRNHIKNAEIKQANILLGWEWYIQSEVVHGDKRGRELGYPTANMHFGETIVPSHGIYAVRVQIEGEDIWRKGASNIGIRPMFETAMPMLETFIFDYDGDLYGKILKVKPVQKLRDEMKFDNLDDLKIQMAKDCETSKAVLSE